MGGRQRNGERETQRGGKEGRSRGERAMSVAAEEREVGEGHERNQGARCFLAAMVIVKLAASLDGIMTWAPSPCSATWPS